jgi:hypothetical protein
LIFESHIGATDGFTKPLGECMQISRRLCSSHAAQGSCYTLHTVKGFRKICGYTKAFARGKLNLLIKCKINSAKYNYLNNQYLLKSTDLVFSTQKYITTPELSIGNSILGTHV